MGKYFMRNAGGVLALLLFSGCSGSSGNLSPSTQLQSVGQSVPTQIAAVSATAAQKYGVAVVSAAPAPYDGDAKSLTVDKAAAAAGKALAVNGPPRFFKKVQAQGQLHTLSYNPSYDQGGQSGLLVTGGRGFTGIYSINTAYQASQINLNPASTNDPNNSLNVLYAPTTHGSDNACLENGSDYWRGISGGATAAFRVYDGCNGGFIYSIPMDQNFMNTYVRVFNGGNSPQYTTEVIKDSNGAWHSLLFNFSTGSYQDLVGARPGGWTYNGGQGWDIFETHYTAGACSVVPPMEASGIRVRSAQNGTWSLLSDPSVVPSVQTYLTPVRNCLNTNSSPSTTVTFPSPPQIGDPYLTAWFAKSS